MLIAFNEKTHTTNFWHFNGSLFFASKQSADSTKVILQPVANRKLFLHKTTIGNSCKESDASNKEQNYLILSIFLYLVRTVSLLKPSPNSYPVKNSSTFKFYGCLLLFSPKMSTTKRLLCCNSEKCRAANMKNWENFLPIPPCPLLLNASGHSCFIFSHQQSARTLWLPFQISLFSNSHSRNSN